MRDQQTGAVLSEGDPLKRLLVTLAQFADPQLLAALPEAQRSWILACLEEARQQCQWMAPVQAREVNSTR